MSEERSLPGGSGSGGNSGASLPPLRPAARLAGETFAAILRLWGATWRRRSAGLERIDAMLARREKVLAVFWHGGYLPLFPLLAGRRACIFSSSSFRGEAVAAISRRFGFAGRCLTETAGERKGEAMRRIAAGFDLVALAVDGPLGPRHIVKKGAVRLAADLGLVVIPVAAAGRRSWTLARRWDRMAIPCPFTCVALACGDPVTIPPGLSAPEVASWCELLRQRLEAIEQQARRLAEGAA